MNRRLLALALPMILALPGCGGAPTETLGDEQVAWIRSMARQTTPEQAPAFEDGVIAREEYEAAALATVGCVRDAGIEVRDVRWQGERRYMFDYGGSSTFEGAQAQGAIYKDCYQTHFRDIDLTWDYQLGPPAASELEEAKRELQLCLAAHGVEIVLDDLSPASIAERFDLMRRLPGLGECLHATEDQYGFDPL